MIYWPSQTVKMRKNEENHFTLVLVSGELSCRSFSIDPLQLTAIRPSAALSGSETKQLLQRIKHEDHSGHDQM
jgi:hypothetical protein